MNTTIAEPVRKTDIITWLENHLKKKEVFYTQCEYTLALETLWILWVAEECWSTPFHCTDSYTILNQLAFRLLQNWKYHPIVKLSSWDPIGSASISMTIDLVWKNPRRITFAINIFSTLSKIAMQCAFGKLNYWSKLTIFI